MTTLADIRTRVRQDLHDTDPATERWSDDQIDRHIAHAVTDLDAAMPREQSTTVATTPGSRDLSVSGLADLIAVEAVEFPAGSFPPSYVRFSTWDGTLTLLVPFEPDGAEARIFYTARHLLDGSGSTVPPTMEDAIAMGAAGYAALELANGTINALTIGGPAVAADYRAWGQAWLTAFRQLLGQNSRANRVRARRMYVPA
jgi:hypothetical protein